MSATRIFRLSGVTLVVGGLLMSLGYFFEPTNVGDPLVKPTMLMTFFGALFVMLGLAGVYARQSNKVGIPGLIGFLLMFFGLPMVVMIIAVIGFTNPATLNAPVVENSIGGTLAGLGVLALLIGNITTAIVTIRAQVWSRWVGIALIASIVLNIGSFLPFADALKFPAEIYLAIIALGLALLSDPLVNASSLAPRHDLVTAASAQ